MVSELKNTDGSGFKRVFSIIKRYLGHFYMGRSPTPKRLQEIRKERIKVIFFYPFKNNPITTLISLSLFIFTFTFWFSVKQPNPYFLLTYLVAWLMLYPFHSDSIFYRSYYNTWEFVANILLLSKSDREKSDLNFESFQVNYNKLRKTLKKRIRGSHGNLLAYDYEISRIIRDIDTFFDATTKILFRRKVMSIPFSPHDEYDIFIADTERQSRLSDDRWQNIEPPPSEYEFGAWEIKKIDFMTIDKFLQYFGDIIIRKPRTKAINTVAIGELFRRWNLIVKNLDKDIFEESKNDVEKYYDEKRERRGLILKMFYELSVLMIIGITVAVIVDLLFN
jgi:hypothetical protein